MSTEMYWRTGAKGFPPRERRTMSAEGTRERDVSVAGMKLQFMCGERRDVNCFARDEPRKG